MDNIIGLRDQIVYNTIDIYVDKENNNNLWGIIHLTEYKNHKPIKRDEIIRFMNYQAMEDFVRNYFNGYELSQPVDFINKQLYFHYVDYCDIKYYYYNGKPNLNHIEIAYREDVNGKSVRKVAKFPKEYENMFIEILKINKRIPPDRNLDSRYKRDIDVYEERANNRREVLRSLTMSFDEFFRLSGKKIKEVKNSGNLVKKLKVLTSISTITAILATGYVLETKNKENSEYLTQYNGVKNIKDVEIYLNKGNKGPIIEKLMTGKYHEVSPDEIKGVTEFIKQIEEANYDNNESFNTFNYTDYFKYGVGDAKTFTESSEILKKIERLYNNCFNLSNNKYVLDKDSVNKYINYVASLTFMYDTYHTNRPVSYVSMETQSITSSYATDSEIIIFDSYPPILRYIIMNQLKNVLLRSNYEVKDKPSYYFKSTDKYDLLSEINKKMENILDEMYFECGYSSNRK